MRPVLAPPPDPDLEPGRAPTFSVLIAAYQAAGMIAEAVESALGQSSPPYEVVVCDDGSTDDIEGALAPYRERIVLLRKENGGGASALNAAARAAAGEFVAILDADDGYAPERLEALGELAASRPDLDILATDAYLIVDGRPAARFCERTPFAVAAQRAEILDRCFLVAPAVRRSRLLAAGGFDESFRIAYDWDCWIRLILDGSRAGLVDEPLYLYRFDGPSLTARRVASLRARVAVLEKTSRRMDLLLGERRALAQALAVHRRPALLAEAEAALREGSPDARRRACAVALGPGFGPRVRVKALAAALAPGVAARRLEKREAQTGYSRLARPDPT